MKKLFKRLKNERGLTLVELLAVFVILAIIATIAFVMIGNVIENSKQDAHIANAQQLIASAKLYESDGNEIPSAGVEDSTLTDSGFLDKLINPWGSEDEDVPYEGTVYLVGEEYKVNLPSIGNECDIDANEELLLSGERDDICASGAGTP